MLACISAGNQAKMASQCQLMPDRCSRQKACGERCHCNCWWGLAKSGAACMCTLLVLTTISKMSSQRTSLWPARMIMYLFFGKMSCPANLRRPCGKSTYMTGCWVSSCAKLPCKHQNSLAASAKTNYKPAGDTKSSQSQLCSSVLPVCHLRGRLVERQRRAGTWAKATLNTIKQ